MQWCSKVFEKTLDCVDLLSFDPGLVNAGIVHVRVDRRNARMCVLHAALLNVRDPIRCLKLETDAVEGRSREATGLDQSARKKRLQKPERVEPYSYRWPSLDFVPRLSAHHVQRLKACATALETESLKFEDQVALLPFALRSVDWLNDDDSSLDYVLVEVQDPQNPQMRSVGHSVQTYYESRNAARASDESPEKQTTVRYVSSRLKLSDSVLTVLGETLCFDSVNGGGAESLSEQLLAVVDARSHAAKKSSAIQVFKVLADHAPDSHPFFVWLLKQRATKHNILDALLQTWAYCMQEGIGFDSGLLNGTRRKLQRDKAKLKREERKRKRYESVCAVPCDEQQKGGESKQKKGEGEQQASALPKRRRVRMRAKQLRECESRASVRRQVTVDLT